MIKRQNMCLSFLLVLCLAAAAQEEDYRESDYRVKLGMKYTAERSGYLSLLADAYQVDNLGIQSVIRIAGKSALETGVYLINQALGAGVQKIYYRNISIPVNYRFGYRNLYVAGGFFGNYIIRVNTFGITNDPLDKNRKLNLGYNICAGLEQKLSERWSLFGELRYFKTFADLRLFKPGFTNYGLGAGINYKLPS